MILAWHAIAHNVIVFWYKEEIRTNQLIGINRFLTFLYFYHLYISVFVFCLIDWKYQVTLFVTITDNKTNDDYLVLPACNTARINYAF